MDELEEFEFAHNWSLSGIIVNEINGEINDARNIIDVDIYLSNGYMISVNGNNLYILNEFGTKVYNNDDPDSWNTGTHGLVPDALILYEKLNNKIQNESRKRRGAVIKEGKRF